MRTSLVIRFLLATSFLATSASGPGRRYRSGSSPGGDSCRWSERRRERPGEQGSVEVAKAKGDQLTTVLAAMDGMGVIAENWLRGAAEAVADRSLKATGKLPQADLETFLFETSHQPRARRLAYEFITKVDEKAPDRLMPKLLDDPSLELRRDAVQRVLDAAAAATETDAKVKGYQEALEYARDLDQVKVCTDELEKLGQKVDTAKHLGFILQWKIIGPFDNTDKKGYEVVYDPEKELDYSAKYMGKTGRNRLDRSCYG